MRFGRPQSLVMLYLSPERLRELFPVPFAEEEPLAVAEPSVSTLIEVDGSYFGVIHGTTTGRVEIEIPEDADPRRAFLALFRSISVRPEEVGWVFGKALDPAIFSPR